MVELMHRLTVALAERYRIERHLGEGGMATVYLAHDLRHERQVALKVLRPELAAVIGGDRFLNEIKVTANLQHPNILPLYDSGAVDTFLYYVMPYVEGESLRQRLVHEKQLSVEEAVNIARDVADALHYAHELGVIHRDIKPENILLQRGKPVVADFGIALAVRQAGGARITETGLSLGTPQYMSPEQAMGDRELDARSDVYAVGCVLYEMLTGEPPFTGPTAQSIVAKLLTESPTRITVSRRSVPPHVEATVAKALEKLPADRFSSAAQFAAALSGAMPVTMPVTGARPAVSASAGQAWGGRMGWVLALIAVGFAGWALLSRPAPASDFDGTRFFITPRSVPVADNIGVAVTISPDGRTIVFVGTDGGKTRLYKRSLTAFDETPIPGTEGANQPTFSPDGTSVAFQVEGRIKRVDVAGGPSLTIASAAGDVRGLSWGPDHAIVFTPASGWGLSRVPASGGEPESLAVPDSSSGVDYRWPTVLPNGKGVLFTEFFGAPEASFVSVLSLETMKITRLTNGTAPRYADGYLLFGRVDGGEGFLIAAPFDQGAQRITGAEFSLVEDVYIKGGGAGEFDVSGEGSLVYKAGIASGDQPLMVDRSGVETTFGMGPGHFHDPRLSPDGSMLVYTTLTGAGHDLWTFDFRSRIASRFTFDGANTAGLWSPDGERILFESAGPNRSGIFTRRRDGSGETERVSDGDLYPAGWTPEGYLLIQRVRGARDILIDSLGDGGRGPILAEPYNEMQPALSPDGRWLAYSSDESGQFEVYLRAWPGLDGKRQVSRGGGMEPIWSGDGRELVYRSSDAVVAVPVRRTDPLELGAPVALFVDVYARDADLANFAIHPSGDRFLMVKSEPSSQELAVIVRALRRRAGGGG